MIERIKSIGVPTCYFENHCHMSSVYLSKMDWKVCGALGPPKLPPRHITSYHAVRSIVLGVCSAYLQSITVYPLIVTVNIQ